MYRKEIHVTSHCEGDIINITDAIGTTIRESGISDGLAHLFVQHSTAALTTIEYETGVLSNLTSPLRYLPRMISSTHIMHGGATETADRMSRQHS